MSCARDTCLVIFEVQAAVLVQRLVHFLEHLAHVDGEAVHSGIPVAASVALEGGEHQGQHHVPVLSHQAHDVLVVPEEEAALSDLQSSATTRRYSLTFYLTQCSASHRCRPSSISRHGSGGTHPNS